MVHFFELKYDASIDPNAHCMFLKNNAIVEKEVKFFLEEGINAPYSSVLSFPVQISTREDERCRFCVFLRREKESWPFPETKYISDKLGVQKH